MTTTLHALDRVERGAGPELQTTFTKFDALGSVLTELSFRCVSLGFARDEETGAVNHYAVYIHIGDQCFQGIGDTPSEALSDALKQAPRAEEARIERAAERVSA